MKHDRRAGVTLIEILIAVSLLSLLSVGVLWSMRIGFNTMDKTDARLIHNRRVSNCPQDHRKPSGRLLPGEGESAPALE